MAKGTKIVTWIPDDHEVASPKKGRINRNSMDYSQHEAVLIELEKIEYRAPEILMQTAG
jgi:hypothetical protein